MKKEYKRILIVILVLIILCLIICIMLCNKKDIGSGGVTAGSDSAPVEPGVIIPGRGYITIPANQKSAAVEFYNPAENEYYLSFELKLLDGDGGFEVLYTSKLVEPGGRIERITLTRTLAAGVYDAQVHVQPYRMDKTPTNNADIQTKLIVKQE